ncbi:MAG TPA: MarR family winged helix-turn-helix transcriptional regulator [Thermoleophilaceae bacterium]|nr:MarR family winged helix-turn-helix transcriptional regulator [Thermoleophilaceae bacterium]
MDTQRDPALIGLLSQVRDAVGAELYARLTGLGFAEIRPAHGCVFANIDEPGSRLTELADRSRLTKQSVGEAVADLEGLGFVERVPDPADGRAKIIRLTPHGADALAAAEEIFADIERRFAEEIGRERYAEFRETLLELQGVTQAQPA